MPIRSYININIILPASLCFILTLLLIPLCMKIAGAIGAIDYPNEIKIHSNPVPRLGGAAIFFSFIFTYTIFPYLTHDIYSMSKTLILSSIIGIFLIGLLDDIKNIKASIKLMFQILNTLLAVIGIYLLYSTTNTIFFIIIFIFILGYINAFNLIDGIDGLASGLAIFIGIGLFVISFISKQKFTMFGSSFLIATSIAFLIFNKNPAKIFLGDCGSTFLGLLIGLMTSLIWLSSRNKFVFIPLTIIISIPIFDSFSTVIRRLKSRKSILMGDRNHSYDLIIKNGVTIKSTILLFYSISFFLSCIGIVLYILIEFR